MTDTNQLPPLPEPEGVIVVGTQALRGFTADQMRAYALQSRAQLAQGEPVTDFLAAFDEAVSQALPRVSHVEYDSHEICKHFAGQLRAILALRPAAQESRIAELEAELAKRHQRLHETEELAGHYLAQRDDLAAEIGRLKTVIDELERREIRSVAQQATPEPVGEPWGWAVNSTLFRGEFAEADAKAEAKRCGGTTRAVALYTRPAPAQAVPMTSEQREAMYARAEARIQKDPNLSWRDAIVSETEAHHGITAQAKDGGA